MSTTTLGTAARLLDRLVEMFGPDKVIHDHAFGPPHSWRNYYEQVAFPPAFQEHTLGQLQFHVQAALTETFEGWKGGEYTFNENTPVHLSEWGHGLDPDGDYFTLRFGAMIMEAML